MQSTKFIGVFVLTPGDIQPSHLSHFNMADEDGVITCSNWETETVLA